jgi:hypothetical protein
MLDYAVENENCTFEKCVTVGKKLIILIIISLYLKTEKLDNENNVKIELMRMCVVCMKFALLEGIKLSIQ